MIRTQCDTNPIIPPWYEPSDTNPIPRCHFDTNPISGSTAFIMIRTQSRAVTLIRTQSVIWSAYREESQTLRWVLRKVAVSAQHFDTNPILVIPLWYEPNASTTAREGFETLLSMLSVRGETSAVWASLWYEPNPGGCGVRWAFWYEPNPPIRYEPNNSSRRVWDSSQHVVG